MWSLLGKLFGQDLTKVSLPVILSEPLSSLQKTAENINSFESILVKAATEKDPLKRLGYVLGHNMS